MTDTGYCIRTLPAGTSLYRVVHRNTARQVKLKPGQEAGLVLRDFRLANGAVKKLPAEWLTFTSSGRLSKTNGLQVCYTTMDEETAVSEALFSGQGTINGILTFNPSVEKDCGLIRFTLPEPLQVADINPTDKDVQGLCGGISQRKTSAAARQIYDEQAENDIEIQGIKLHSMAAYRKGFSGSCVGLLKPDRKILEKLQMECCEELMYPIGTTALYSELITGCMAKP